MAPSNSNLTTILIVGAAFSVSVAAIIHFPSHITTISIPLSYVAICIFYRPCRPLLPFIVLSYAMVYLVAVGRNWQAFGTTSFLAFFNGPPRFLLGEAIRPFSFLYLPALSLVVSLDMYRIPNELAATRVWKIRPLRVVMVAILVILLWREAVVERYRAIVQTLDARGVVIPRILPGLRLAHRWFPVLLQTLLAESIEKHVLIKQLNTTPSAWKPMPLPVSISAVDVVFLVVIGAVWISIIWHFIL